MARFTLLVHERVSRDGNLNLIPYLHSPGLRRDCESALVGEADDRQPDESLLHRTPPGAYMRAKWGRSVEVSNTRMATLYCMWPELNDNLFLIIQNQEVVLD